MLEREGEHPLIGRIWDVEREEYVQLDSLLADMPSDSWLLLGENHQNPEHHQLETDLIHYLSEQERLSHVAFEMATTAQQESLDIYLGASTSEITEESLNWNKGWPWPSYGAPVTAALQNAERVVATDLTRDGQMSAYRAEQFSLPENSAYQEYMFDLLYTSHCGHLPESQLGNMLQVQVARDREMIRNLKANTGTEINVMIAGSAHTRKDIGIPFIAEELETTTLMMVPVNDSVTPSDYLPESYSPEAVTDYLVFTGPVAYRDMCGDIPKRKG